MIDMGLKLKCLRQHRGISQKDLARASKVGEKTISSFETGQRLVSLKVTQLVALLDSLGVTLAEFIVWDPEQAATPATVVPIHSTLPTVVRTTRRTLPIDPLRGFRNDDDRIRSPQSALAHRV